MAGVVLSCTGALIDSLWVPPLELRRGEFLCLHMPGIACSPAEERLVAALTGIRPAAGLVRRGNISWIELPRQPRGLLQLLFKHPRAVDWLRDHGRLTLESAKTIVARLDGIVANGIGNNRIGYVPWEGRMLLALEAAWARREDAIVFTTVGAAGLPEMMMFDAIRPRLPECAAIHLCYERENAGRIERVSFEGARCVEITSSDTNHPARQAS